MDTNRKQSGKFYDKIIALDTEYSDLRNQVYVESEKAVHRVKLHRDLYIESGVESDSDEEVESLVEKLQTKLKSRQNEVNVL